MTPNGVYLNGHSTNGHMLTCASDYEPAPVLDVVAREPKPGWRHDFPLFTHNLSWVDADGCSHSLTLRSDDLPGLFADLKLLKYMIRASKEKAKERHPETSQGQPEPDSDVPPCKIHGSPMVRKQSRRTKGIYFSHQLPDGSLCFGREKKS
jgi:hypothetical protein